MTVCITVDADPDILLITDCLVTGLSANGFVTPASVGLEHREKNLPFATLVSKFALLDGGAIVGFAGSKDSIQSFFDDFRHYFKFGAKQERPMKWASKLVNDFNEGLNRKENEVSMIGFAVVQTEENWAVNWIRRLGTPIVHTDMGDVAAIGSGSHSLLGEISYFVKNFSMDGDVDESNLRLFCAVGAINTRMLFDNSGEIADPSWGGYYQLNGYDARSRKWFHSPDWVHLAFKIDISESAPRFWIVNKAAIYRAGYSISHLTVACQLNGENSTVSWKIESGLASDAEQQPVSSGLDDFQPQFATVAFFVQRGDERWVRYTTLNGHLMKHLILSCEGTHITSFGLEQKYLDSIASEEKKSSPQSTC